MTPRTIAQDHAGTLAAVVATPQAPRASDWQLEAARKAGLIVFSAWPAGVWKLTSSGVAARAQDEEPRT